MKLTDRKKSLAGPSVSDLVHIVKTGDTTQNSAGSSYKIEIGEYAPLFPDKFVTGGTYSNGTALFKNNSGGTFSVTGFKTSDLVVTGGTYSNGTAIYTNNTGGTFSVTGFKTDDIFVTGGTYSSGTATFRNNTGGTFNVTGFKTDDLYISGMTFNTGNYNLTINRNDGTNFTQSLGILASDMNVTGGTYNSSTGTATFTNNSGGTFQVTGFLVQNLQKTITTSYILTSGDNNYTILINNSSTPINITIPSGLMAIINVGFIQQGTGDVTFITSGTTIRTPLTGAYKIKGQNYNAYLEQIGSTNDYQLLGNLKV